MADRAMAFRYMLTMRSAGDMKKAKDFPFEAARRVTAREVETARKAIEGKLGTVICGARRRDGIAVRES